MDADNLRLLHVLVKTLDHLLLVDKGPQVKSNVFVANAEELNLLAQFNFDVELNVVSVTLLGVFFLHAELCDLVEVNSDVLA